MFYDHALQPDVIVENQILQVEAVKVFRRGCASGISSESNAVTKLALWQRRFDISLLVPVKINLMLATPRELRRQPAA